MTANEETRPRAVWKSSPGEVPPEAGFRSTTRSTSWSVTGSEAKPLEPRPAHASKYPVAQVAVELPMEVSKVLCLFPRRQRRAPAGGIEGYILSGASGADGIPLRVIDLSYPRLMSSHGLNVGDRVGHSFKSK